MPFLNERGNFGQIRKCASKIKGKHNTINVTSQKYAKKIKSQIFLQETISN